MSSAAEISLFPIAGWSVGPIKAHEAVTVKFNFLTNPFQSTEEANQSPDFVLTSAPATELAETLLRVVQTLQSVEFQAPPGARH